MKKKASKLRLSRETLLHLQEPLRHAAGGYSWVPGMCNPSIGVGATECISRCIECPMPEPEY